MINYGNIHQSNEYYSEQGFHRIEAPWTVTQQISDITRPKDAKDFKLIHDDNKVLVASGEQSFLYLYAKDFLPKGRFQTTTPCFRKEAFDLLHVKYFIKTELIDTHAVNIESLENMIQIALDNFVQLTDSSIRHKLEIISTYEETSAISYDIRLGDVEIGSYGIRSHNLLDWVYGTGIAEPRFSAAHSHQLRYL